MDNEQEQIFHKLKPYVSQFPAKVKKLKTYVNMSTMNDMQLYEIGNERLEEILFRENGKKIYQIFIKKLNYLLTQIKPHLGQYQAYKSLQYLVDTIYDQMDKHIIQGKQQISEIIQKNTIQWNQGQGYTNQGYDYAQKIYIHFEENMQIFVSELLAKYIDYYDMKQHIKEDIQISTSETNQNITEIIQKQIHNYVEQNKGLFTKYQNKIKQNQQQNIMRQIDTQFKNTHYDYQQEQYIEVNKDAQSRISLKYSSIIYGQNKEYQYQGEQFKQLKILIDKDFTQLLYQIPAQIKRQLKKKFHNICQTFKSQFKFLQFRRNVDINKIKDFLQKYIQKICLYYSKQDQENNYPYTTNYTFWVLLIYRIMKLQYIQSPQANEFIKQFCQFLQDQILQNKRDTQLKPKYILQILNSQKPNQSFLLNTLRRLPLTQQNNKNLNSKKKTQIQQVNKAIKAQIKSISMQSQKQNNQKLKQKQKQEKLPFIEFQRMTLKQTQCINFLISGFLSQDSCKVQEWRSIIKYFSQSAQVYSIRWESKKVLDILSQLKRAAVQSPTVTAGHPLLSVVLKFALTLGNILQNPDKNPFNIAFQNSVITGTYIADLIIKNFQGHQINLIGFSLGTFVIQNILLRLLEKKSLHLINKVILMGGVADKQQIQKIIERASSPLSVINVHTENDTILKVLLKTFQSQLKPVGLNQIKEVEGHTIMNYDCSEQIYGHLFYRSNLSLLRKRIGLA